MEKNPFDKTLDESESEESNIEKARSILENLKNIDLSTKQGRCDVAFMYSMRLKDAPHFVHGFVPLNNITELSVVPPNSLASKSKNFDIPTINDDWLLDDFEGVRNYYGHLLCKRGYEFVNFMFDGPHSFEKDKKMLDGTKEDVNDFLFTYILCYSANASSQTLNSCRISIFFNEIYEKIQHGDISKEDGKKHPNYPLALELALKSDKQQKTWSDILFKIFSSYVHTGNFVPPELPIERDKLEEIVKKIEDLTHILHQRRPYSIYQDLTIDNIIESVDAPSFSPELEAEIKAWIEYIDYFQELLDEYNSKMHYFGVEEKTKSNSF